jgi:UDP-N-acetylglucosamine--dolichyl-phosphate N-acetylglucosaminephosphotransferase
MWLEGFFISLIASLASGHLIIKVANSRKALLVKDMHKRGIALVSTLGGVILIAGFCAGMLYLVAFGGDLVVYLAALSSIMLVSLLGLLDDILNLPQAVRALLPVLAAAPLIAIQAGDSSMAIPLLGLVNFGIWYQLLAIPIGVTGAANAINMVAGLNGLEAGMSALMAGTFLSISLKLGFATPAALSAVLLGCLLAFLYYNWTPAKILPGNSGSYFAGTAIAAIAIIGNMEKAAIIMIAPYCIELLLKARTRFEAESFGKLEADGTLSTKGIDSLTHLVMKAGRFKESQVVLALMLIQSLFCTIAYLSAG